MSEGNARRLFFEALELMDASRFEDAEQRLRDALSYAPSNGSILTNLSVVLRQQDKLGTARDYAEQAVAINPDNVEALLVLADAYTHEGNLADALAAYDRVIRLDPGIAQVHNNRGLVLAALGRQADARASFDRAIALEPGLCDAHINRGNALRHLKRPDEALAAYDKALALDPDLAHAWLGGGNIFFDLKRYHDAAASYGAALALNAGLPHAWLGRANVLCKLGHHSEALAAYQRALALKPDFVGAWLGQGNLLCELGRYDEALMPYDRALALQPDLAEAWLGRGNVFHDLKRHEEALTAYDKALAASPELSGAWLGRGNALRATGRRQEAIDAYRQAVTAGGDAASISYCLAALGAEPVPAAPPARFVAELFDAYANDFDRDLIDRLHYRTPALLGEAIKRHAPHRRALDILDLGCGTGLMGAETHQRARRLVGVDLSAKMLEKARAREIYDQLSCRDVVAFMQTHEKQFDLIVAADVFTYLGDLAPVFRVARAALRNDGLFCFSVEASDDADFVLRTTLRYAHAEGYLRRLAEQCRFAVDMIEQRIIRQDAGADVTGHLAVMRCR
jgi:predicted TPR repeat methyltransferase